MKPEKGKWYWVTYFSGSTEPEREQCVAVTDDGGIFRHEFTGAYWRIPDERVLGEAEQPRSQSFWMRLKTLFQ